VAARRNSKAAGDGGLFFKLPALHFHLSAKRQF
jgi:hypothetical protein